MDFQVWDFPGQLDYFDPTFDTTEIFSEIGALVWVIDAQDEYSESLNRLTTSIMNLQTTFPHINVEVFVHKTDSLNDEYKADIFQDIVQKVGDDLSDAGYINPNVSYHLTSIYDHSIFEAFSKVVQKLIPELNAFQNLLDTLVERSGMTKAYLFDIQSKIYVASDTRPTDMDTYEMASSFIDVVVDIIDLHTYDRKDPKKLGEQKAETEASMTFDHVNSMVYLMEMNRWAASCTFPHSWLIQRRFLVLVAVIEHEKAKDKKGLIDYNAHVFQDALTELLARRWENKQAKADDHDEALEEDL
jgi:Ras-related GTP-binding protein C/D